MEMATLLCSTSEVKRALMVSFTGCKVMKLFLTDWDRNSLDLLSSFRVISGSGVVTVHSSEPSNDAGKNHSVVFSEQPGGNLKIPECGIVPESWYLFLFLFLFLSWLQLSLGSLRSSLLPLLLVLRVGSSSPWSFSLRRRPPRRWRRPPRWWRRLPRWWQQLPRLLHELAKGPYQSSGCYHLGCCRDWPLYRLRIYPTDHCPDVAVDDIEWSLYLSCRRQAMKSIHVGVATLERFTGAELKSAWPAWVSSGL